MLHGWTPVFITKYSCIFHNAWHIQFYESQHTTSKTEGLLRNHTDCSRVVQKEQKFWFAERELSQLLQFIKILI